MNDGQPLSESLIATMLLAGNADAIVASDAEGIIRCWNPGAERIFGFSAAEALGQSLDIIIPERQRARHWEGYRHVMATGKSRYSAGELLAVPGTRRDGTRLSVEFTITPVSTGGGKIIGLIAVMRDVTERFEETKRLRKQLAARPAMAGGGAAVDAAPAPAAAPPSR